MARQERDGSIVSVALNRTAHTSSGPLLNARALSSVPGRWPYFGWSLATLMYSDHCSTCGHICSAPSTCHLNCCFLCSASASESAPAPVTTAPTSGPSNQEWWCRDWISSNWIHLANSLIPVMSLNAKSQLAQSQCANGNLQAAGRADIVAFTDTWQGEGWTHR